MLTVCLDCNTCNTDLQEFSFSVLHEWVQLALVAAFCLKNNNQTIMKQSLNEQEKTRVTTALLHHLTAVQFVKKSRKWFQLSGWAQVNTTWSCEPHSTVHNLLIWEVHVCSSSESVKMSRSLPLEVLQALETGRNPAAHPERTGKPIQSGLVALKSHQGKACSFGDKQWTALMALLPLWYWKEKNHR